MKIQPIVAYAIAATSVLVTQSLAGTSAQQAIESLRATEGKQVADNIVHLTGRFGQDQPQEWEILAQRGNQFFMFIVDEQAVISMSKVHTSAVQKLSLTALKIDSTRAFKITDAAAKKARVGFDSLSYDLKPRLDNAAPVWVVSLSDVEGFLVGEVHITADSGSILLTNWDREQLNRPAVASTSGTRGIISDRARSTQTGTTLDGIRDGLANVSNSIKGVFRKGEVSNPDNHRSPKTSKSRPE